MVIRAKKQKHCLPGELEVGDCWIGLTQAKDSGLILAARVGKRTDRLLDELVTNTEGQTNCQQWDTDGWSGYPRVLPPEVQHQIGKVRTQRLERTNSILRYSDRTMASRLRTILVNGGSRRR